MFSLIISPWVMGRTGGWLHTGTNEKNKKGKDDFFLNPVNYSNSVIFFSKSHSSSNRNTFLSKLLILPNFVSAFSSPGPRHQHRLSKRSLFAPVLINILSAYLATLPTLWSTLIAQNLQMQVLSVFYIIFKNIFIL